MRKKMSKCFLKTASRLRRKKAYIKKVQGTSQKPRLVIFRSLNNIYAQMIDDVAGKTLVACSTLDKEAKFDGNKCEKSFQVGKLLGQRAKEAKIEAACVDRNGYKYHGRVKAVVEGVREAGLSL